MAGPDSATGILQVVGVVRKDYNARNGTNFQPDDLFKPEVCITLAADTLRRIITTYNKHPSLRESWYSRRWVELLTLGWNAGYSEAAGVGYVVGEMEAAGVPASQITIDNVKAWAAKLPGASQWLQRDLTWHKRVADTYLRENGSSGLLLVAAVMLAFWL